MNINLKHNKNWMLVWVRRKTNQRKQSCRKQSLPMVITPLSQAGSHRLRLRMPDCCLSFIICSHSKIQPPLQSNHQIAPVSILEMELRMERRITAEKWCWRNYEYVWQTQAASVQRMNTEATALPFLYLDSERSQNKCSIICACVWQLDVQQSIFS